MAVFVALCGGGVVFLVRVFFALSRETRPAHLRRRKGILSAPVVVQLPPDPIFTASAIRPDGVPESAPFAIVSNSSNVAAEFYVGAPEREPFANDDWHLFVNPKQSRAKRTGAR